VADLTAIRNNLAAAITKYTGLRCDAQARDQVSPPCCVILPGQPLVTYGMTMDPENTVTIALSVLVIISDAAPVEKTQRALDAYLGVGEPGYSVPDAIEQDFTLGGTVEYIQSVTADRYGRLDYNGVTYFGARVSVTIGAD